MGIVDEISNDINKVMQVVFRGDTDDHAREKREREAREAAEARKHTWEYLNYGLSFVSIVAGVFVVWAVAR
jgi:hypothetical protein